MGRTRTCFGEPGSLGGCWGYSVKFVHKERQNLDKRLQNDVDTIPGNVQQFSSKALRKATNNFGNDNRLGRGGFSSYYKGTLENGTEVAVEVVENGGQALDFVSLVSIMSRIRHRNVIEFIGCCIEENMKMIVCEYVGGQRLDQLLFNPDSNSSGLSWATRASVCLGIARGVEYFHHGIYPCVVHRDIKPANVLLDENYNPKIANFGIARHFDDNNTCLSGRICGTLGYLDPEYYAKGTYTEKADVYSFGILLLEVICGKRAVEFNRDNYCSIVDWVWELREEDKMLEAVDPKLTGLLEDEAKRFLNVALFCVQVSSELRPSMAEVLLMLLGGCDISDRVLMKPEHSRWPSIDLSVPASPARFFGHDVQEKEVTAASSDSVSSMSVYKGLTAVSGSFRKTSSEVVESKGEQVTGLEIEEESDGFGSAVREGEWTQASHVREAQLYGSTKSEGPTVVSEPGQSDAIIPKPELLTTPSTDSLIQSRGVEATIETHICHDVLSESLRLTETDSSVVPLTGLGSSVNAETKMRTSAATHTLYRNEDVVGLEADAGKDNKSTSPLKVTLGRPIHLTVEKILETLRDAQPRTIGLHGRSGSGKTTVLKTLLNHPTVKQLFNKVIYVTLAGVGFQQKIQNAIVEQLSMNATDSSLGKEIAALNSQALLNRKVLWLLDDVWERFNLLEVGIPDPGNSFWTVLATRSMYVSEAMAERGVKMEVLSTSEAWEFFCNQVSNVIDSPKIVPFARAVVEECHGVPLIISAVATALRVESNVVQWELAVKSFKSSGIINTADPYMFITQVKYCYDRLKSKDVKRCFLYCALFTREGEIDISILVDCFINEGLLDGRRVGAYQRGHDIVEHLVNCSLLEATGGGCSVKMHNVIRDSALVILSRDIEGHRILTRSCLRLSFVPNSEQDVNHYLTIAGGQLKGSPSLLELEEATMAFLMDNCFSNLPGMPCCSSLLALFLQRNSCLRVIPASFFDYMPALKILDLSKTRIKMLPDSFSKLKSLQFLALRDCERFHILPPSIGLLKALTVLDLQGTELTYLPDSVRELTNLKQLRVSFYGTISLSGYSKLPEKLIPDGIFRSLDLSELGISVYHGDCRWESTVSDIIKEVSSLDLSALYFHFPKLDHLENFLQNSQPWKVSNLATFNFVVGLDYKHAVSQVSQDAELTHIEEERCLRFVNGENIPDAVMEVLKRATSLYLDHHLTVLYLSEFGFNAINALKVCIMRDCPELLAILKDKEIGEVVLPYLEYLSINYLWKLERIWVTRCEVGSFARLRYLSVHTCPKLRHIFTASMLSILHNLEEMIIEDCASLKHVVVEDEEVDVSDRSVDDVSDIAVNDSVHTDRIVIGVSDVLKSLKVLKLHYLPELCSIWTSRWPPLQYLSFYDCPKLKNLFMEANDVQNIKEIATDENWWDTLEWDNPTVAERLQERIIQVDVDEL